MIGRESSLVVGSLVLIVCAGCSNRPERVPAPKWDPNAAADKAMELYDANSDGFIKGDELDAVPSIKLSLASIDKDGDGGVSRDEVQQRFSGFVENRLGLMSQSCTVYMRGRPVEGADVVFEPEPFVADIVSSARGKTDQFGMAMMTSEGETDGMKVGFYKVKINAIDANGKNHIKPEYNEQTTLGVEISLSSPIVQMGTLEFHVK